MKQSFYAPFARGLAETGLAVLTYDYRGIGASADRPLAKDPATMGAWIEDANAAQQWLADRLPTLPLLVVGHSFGAQVAASLDQCRKADALALVGGQSGYFGAFPRAVREALWVFWKLGLPTLTRTLGYLPRWVGLGEPLPRGVAEQWARWCLSPTYAASELPELRPRWSAYRGRVLSLSFTDDDFAPLANVEWLNAQMNSADLEHRHFLPRTVGLDSVGHFGLFREKAESALWPTVARFLHEAARDTVGAPTGSSMMRAVMSDLAYGR